MAGGSIDGEYIIISPTYHYQSGHSSTSMTGTILQTQSFSKDPLADSTLLQHPSAVLLKAALALIAHGRLSLAAASMHSRCPCTAA